MAKRQKAPITREQVSRRRRETLGQLDEIRKPLMRELAILERKPSYGKGREAHLCCTRQWNQMRISPVEAQAIADAFRHDPELRKKLPRVLERLREVLPTLADNDERQNFDCPLLEGKLCLVHHRAKPIGCAAWHPPVDGEDFELTPAGWKAFERRDQLNDSFHGGQHWKLRVIPLWLKRIWRRELQSDSRRGASGALKDGREQDYEGGHERGHDADSRGSSRRPSR